MIGSNYLVWLDMEETWQKREREMLLKIGKTIEQEEKIALRMYVDVILGLC